THTPASTFTPSNTRAQPNNPKKAITLALTRSELIRNEPRMNTNEHESPLDLVDLNDPFVFHPFSPIRGYSCSFVAEILILEIYNSILNVTQPVQPFAYYRFALH